MTHDSALFNHKDFRISIRPWQPLDLPYPVTQDMVTQCFRQHKEDLQKYLYLGWRKINDERGKRKTIFCIATGESRLEAKQKFKKGDCWEVLPTKQA